SLSTPPPTECPTPFVFPVVVTSYGVSDDPGGIPSLSTSLRSAGCYSPLDPPRVILLVLDSVGVGAAPDAAAYGDEGANTMRHVDEAAGGLSLEHLGRLGIGNVVGLAGTPPAPVPLGAFGTMAEVSAGK